MLAATQPKRLLTLIVLASLLSLSACENTESDQSGTTTAANTTTTTARLSKERKSALQAQLTTDVGRLTKGTTAPELVANWQLISSDLRSAADELRRDPAFSDISHSLEAEANKSQAYVTCIQTAISSPLGGSVAACNAQFDLAATGTRIGEAVIALIER